MIVITGGAGFIGSNIAAAAQDMDDVAIVDSFGRDEAKWRNIAKRNLYAVVHPTSLDMFLDDNARYITHVIHMGAISSPQESNVDLIIGTNIRLSQRLWRWCTTHNVPFIYASSASTYGDGSAGFDDTLSARDLSILRPMTPYAWSKHAFDVWASSQAEKAVPKMPPQWVGLKFFNVYGPNEYHKDKDASLITQYRKRAGSDPTGPYFQAAKLFKSERSEWPDGGQMRDHVYVRDCIDVVMWMINHPDISGIFNVGTGQAHTWMDMMQWLYSSFGEFPMPSPEFIRNPGDDRTYQYFTEANLDKLRFAGYDRPFTAPPEGIREYVDGYLSGGDPFR